jgi:hypothetical protein
MPRELIEPHKGDKRYVRRKGGKFTTRQTDVGRSLAADRRSKAKTIVRRAKGTAAIAVPISPNDAAREALEAIRWI